MRKRIPFCFEDGNVAIMDMETYANNAEIEWRPVAKWSLRWLYYRVYIWAWDLVRWIKLTRMSVRWHGWHDGLAYIAALLDVAMSSLDSEDIDWRRWGIYTEAQAKEAGICPKSILDIDVNDEKWRDTVL